MMASPLSQVQADLMVGLEGKNQSKTIKKIPNIIPSVFRVPPHARGPKTPSLEKVFCPKQDSNPRTLSLKFDTIPTWPLSLYLYSIHSSKFSKRNYIFPLHSQKLVTLFWPDFPKFYFFVDLGCANRKDWSE